MNFSDGWEALSFLQKVYWIVAIPSTLLFLVQFILTLTGGDGHDVGHDFAHEHDSDFDHGSFHVFSLKSILAFLMVFGWSGLAVVSSGKLSVSFVLLISFFAGLAMMLVTAWLLFLFSKLEQSGNLDVENAVGESGEVYLTIPGQKKGIGKIQIIVQGQLQTLDAVTAENEELKTGTKITVVHIEPDKLLSVIKMQED